MVELTKNLQGPPSPEVGAEIAATGKALQRGGMLLTVLIVLIVHLHGHQAAVLISRPGPAAGRRRPTPSRNRADRRRRSTIRSSTELTPLECPDRCRTSPNASPTSSRASPGRRHLDGDALAIDDEATFRGRDDPRPRLDGGVRHRRGDGRRRPVADPRGGSRARRPQREHRGAVPGAGPRRGLRLHRSGDQHPGPDLRHGPDGLRGGGRRRRRRGHPRARPERADVHVPAADRLLDRGPRGCRRRRLARPGLPPGRPLPVQREEVRRPIRRR